MYNLRKFILLLGVLLPLVFPAAAGATSSTDIVIHTHIFISDHSHGTFTSAAPLCPSGTFTVTSPGPGKANGGAFAGGHTTRFTVTAVAHFTCADGSGTFDIQFHPQGDVTSLQLGPTPWVVLSGTGAYSDMHGTGVWTFTWAPGQQGSEGFETFTGQVHFD